MNRQIVLLLICFIVVLLPANMFGGDDPTLNIRAFELQERLSNRQVKCITQDSVGFLWIGTSNGLNRYDGYSLTIYNSDVENESTLADNYIQRLYVDNEYTLWVLVPGYLCRYNTATDDFTRFKYSSELKNTQTSNPGAIIEDETGMLWIGTPEMGLYSFDKSTETFTPHSLIEPNIDALDIDKNGRLWVCAPGKVYLLDTETNQVDILQLPMYEAIVSINLDHNYILARHRLYRVAEDENGAPVLRETKNLYPKREFELLSILRTDRYNWFGSRNEGVTVYDRQKDCFYFAKYDRQITNSLRDNSVSSLYEDRYGVVWIGTDDGLNLVPPFGNYFKHYEYNEDSSNSICSNFVTSIDEDSNRAFWIGTYEGISILDPETDKITNITSVNTGKSKVKVSNVRDLMADSDGDMWVCLKNQILRYDVGAKTWSAHPVGISNVRSTDLLCVYVDESVWVGSYGNGLFQVNKETGATERGFNTINSDISSDFIKSIIRLDDGRICLASLRTGIDIYDTKTSEFKNYRFSDLTRNYVSDYINEVFQDSRGDIWVLSWHGVFVYDKDMNLKRVLTVREGLPTNEITSIAEDKNRDIWLGTSNGMSRIYYDDDINDLRICNFNSDDGLGSNNISSGGLFVTPDRESIYVCTTNGFNSFDIDDVPVNENSVTPTLLRLRVFNTDGGAGADLRGDDIFVKSLFMEDEVELTHEQNNIMIEFSSLDFASDEKPTYAYKLDGLQNDWIYVKDLNLASFGNVPPGDYTFLVKAENTDGIWSEEQTLNIRVLPPWWNTWWAYILYVLLFASMVYGLIKLLLRQQQIKQNKRLEQVENEMKVKLRDITLGFYTNLSHDIRTPLTLITGPLTSMLKKDDIAPEVRSKLVIINKNAQYLLTIINHLLDLRKNQSQMPKLKLAKTNIVELMRETIASFSLLTEKKNVTVELVTDKQDDSLWIDSQVMVEVFYNLLSNAVKFTDEGGKIMVSMTNADNKLVIELVDTGIGIPKDKLGRIFDNFYQVKQGTFDTKTAMNGSGIGLSIAKMYIEMHQGTITVDSEEGVGTKFTITLPTNGEIIGKVDEPDAVGKASDEEPIAESLNDIDAALSAPATLDVSFIVNKGQSDVNNEQSDNANKEQSEVAPEGNSGNGDFQIVLPKEGEKSTVLVVDDNMDILNYIEECLKHDFNVITATNGNAGLVRAKDDVPDIIISDIMMPVMDGYAFAQRVKNDEITQHIPFLFLTAKATAEDAMKGFNFGAVDYISKPFNEDMLLAKVKNMIKDRNLLKRRILAQYQALLRDIPAPQKEESTDEPNLRGYEIEDPFFAKVLKFVEDNLENPDLSPDMVADDFGISKNQLYRKLKSISDISAADMIRELRMKRAIELVLNTDKTVSEIAYQLNYSDPFHFSKMFKKATGLSPQQYRKAQGSNQS